MNLAVLIASLSIITYGLGSIPFGYLLAKMAGIGDIRKIGSGSTGATNVIRTGHTFIGASTLLLDGAKGFAAIALARYVFIGEFIPAAALIVVLGHVFPVWLNFRGGKGVATTIGVMFALGLWLGLAACGLWILVFSFSRISSLSSLLSISYSPVAAYLLDNYFIAAICLSLAIIIVWTHRSNIKRLLSGNEYAFTKYPAA